MTITNRNIAETAHIAETTHKVMEAATRVRSLIGGTPDKPTKASLAALQEASDELSAQIKKLMKKKDRKPGKAGSDSPMSAMMRAMRD